MESIIKKDIMAIVPKYIQNKGNCTLIYTKSEVIEVNKSIKTVIRNICKYYHLDLRASNDTYGKLLCARKNPPVPFTSNDIFILVKTRKPIGQHDGAHGYVKIDSIDKIVYKSERDRYPCIILASGQSIEALCTMGTLNKNMSNGVLVKKLLGQESSNTVRETSPMYLDEEMPATKKDIALLYMMIMKLRQ